jgi:hypothetical protein
MLHASVEPHLAGQLASFASGVALPRSLLLREPAADPSADDIRLLAHELTHVAQIQLAGGDARPARWLVEGMAEWIAYDVVNGIVPGALEAQRRHARPVVCDALRSGELGLAALGAPRAFVRFSLRRGPAPAYQLVFRLVDELIRRTGVASLRTYFDAFRESADPDRNFVHAFGLTLGEFADRVASSASDCATRPGGPSPTPVDERQAAHPRVRNRGPGSGVRRDTVSRPGRRLEDSVAVMLRR